MCLLRNIIFHLRKGEEVVWPVAVACLALKMYNPVVYRIKPGVIFIDVSLGLLQVRLIQPVDVKKSLNFNLTAYHPK